jgi:hypothetical protein
MLSINAKKQQELRANYMVFRVNFLAFWLLCNILFAGLVENLASNEKTSTKVVDGVTRVVANCGEINYLLIFAMYLASLVVYKLFFAVLHIIRFKLLFSFSTSYKVYQIDLEEDARKLRAETKDWDKSLLDSDMRILGDDPNEDDDQLLLSQVDQSDNRGQE